jgi:tetratricopeptide (TPR) repeat protein
MSEQPPIRRVMISSTAPDLPEHRKHARDACERMSMLPLVMEQMTASPADALTLSRQYVEQADFYLGIFAFRYGCVPEGQDKSITELEYDRAIERKIPTFIFIAHGKHPVSFDDVETGAGSDKLHALKERLKKDHVVRFFRSAEELRTEIITALSVYRLDDAAKLHFVSDIPKAPESWVAHPYTLLGNGPLVGRRDELNVLTDWVATPSSDLYRARLLALVAIGGMGKSALAWTWWNEIAPHEMKPLAGRMWWSFYESDARFENFTARALAYLTGRPRAETDQIPARDREDQLIAILDREPHLVVLDGLERELLAYARMDAAHLADDDLDAKTAHAISLGAGLPATAAQSFVGETKLRQTTDPRTGQFLRRLTAVRAGRTLVTTRLFPYELQDFNSEPLRGASVLCLRGLSDDGAVTLWRSAGLSGERDTLVPLFRSFEGHPLLVRALAGEIARDRRSPGDFETWKEHHPDFNPVALPLVQRRSHVLSYALQGLRPDELALLRAIAGFRMPAAYETLAALLVGNDAATRPFPSEDAFDRALADLDERGLVGWDRLANRYDLHPIVRGVVWSGAGEGDRQAIAERMRAHFEAMPAMHWETVERLEDLTPAIELYVSLIRLGRYDDAVKVFIDRLENATFHRLSASRQSVELLAMLFPDGVEHEPRVQPSYQGYALNAIARGYRRSGEPGRAVRFYNRSADLDDPKSAVKSTGQRRPGVLASRSSALQLTGDLHAAEASAFRSLRVARDAGEQFQEAASWQYVGLSRAARAHAHGDVALRRSLDMWHAQSDLQGVGLVTAYLAQSAVWRGEGRIAGSLAARAWEQANHQRVEDDFIRAARLQGEVALAVGDLDRADERLHHALTRARAVNLVQEELPTLTALAALHLRRGDIRRAREHLAEVWDAAERGPYPLLHADARNVLAEIEMAEHNIPAAIAAATAACRLAWCDGPPFAYDYGLRTARAHLHALGAPEPDMPPYDASKHEPIEEIPIEPDEAASS